MAMNPMQKKARTSFLLGMFLTLIITGIIIALLLMQLGKLNKEKAAIQYKDVYVLSTDVKSGEHLDTTVAKIKKVETTTAPSNAITSSNVGTYLTENSTSKIALSLGTVLTTDMINIDGKAETSDKRLQEFNMVLLPSMLEQGAFVDIRLRLPTGEDYIVLSKKYVEDTNEETMWIKLGEDEILTMSNAIVDAYIMEGSLLYATTYTDAGMQEASTPTYIASASAVRLMNVDPNITAEARAALQARYTAERADQRNVINDNLNKYSNSAMSSIENNLQEEIQKQKSLRKEYVDSL